MLKWWYLPLNLLLIILYGCDPAPDVKSLYPIKEYNHILLSSVWNIQEHSGNFFVNDFENDRILVYDSSLRLINTFGKSGRGPGEFNGAGSLGIYKDSIYVYDEGGMRVNVYTIKGEYKRMINLPPVQLDWSKFIVKNEKIYMPSPFRSDSDILILNLNGELIQKVERNQGKFEYNHFRLLLSYKDQIIALNQSAPIVERFSDTGVLLEEFDLRSIRELDGLWNFFKKNYGNRRIQNGPTHTKLLFGDAYLDNSFLYVLCSGWPGRDKYTYIIKLSIGEKKIRVNNIFKIQGEDPSMSFFDSFAVKENRLLGFEVISGKIYEFDLTTIE